MDATFEGEPTWPVLRERAADGARVRPAARAVPAADRGEPDGPADRRVRDLGRPEGVLRPLGGSVRAAGARRAAPARRRRSSSRRATPSALGCSSSTSSRTFRAISSWDASTCRREDRRRFGDPPLDRPSDELRALLRFEAERAAGLLAAGELLRARIGGRLGRAVGLFGRGGLGRARRARVGRLGHVHAAAEAVAGASRARGRADAGAMSVDAGLRGGRCASPARGRRTSPTGSWCCRGRSGTRSRRCTPSRGRSTTSPTGRSRSTRSATRLEALARGARRDRRASRDARRARRRACRATRIPRDALAALVDGGLQDTEQTRYATSTSCAATARRSPARSASRASPSTAPTTSDRARTLGVALQLINIIRDVAEDWQLDRVYLPQDELARPGVPRTTSRRGARRPSGGR